MYAPIDTYIYIYIYMYVLYIYIYVYTESNLTCTYSNPKIPLYISYYV